MVRLEESGLDALTEWAAELGYDRIDGAFVRVGDREVDAHPFAPEIRAILTPAKGVGAEAVFCIDRVPTVCLLSRRALNQDPALRRQEVRSLCERLWNQNLARVVLIVDETSLEAWSVDNSDADPQQFSQDREVAPSVWSVAGLLSGEALRGRDAWFDPQKRVDKDLLDNILVLVAKLTEEGLEAARARRLIARVIFVTYLEDRGIVGESYRVARGVKPLYELVKEHDAPGLQKLFRHLRNDFNGDFLSSADGEGGWADLSPGSFRWLSEFLRRTTLRSLQTSFWRYDFSHIPIELISSIYETFLASKDAASDQPAAGGAKRRQGAYYTPRLLADWVVDLALQGRDILKERIFDAACGSGMLLTAAFRRLIRAYEMQAAREGRRAEADFTIRRKLLLEHIFGGDIDEDACQLTAFSLYLALLSDLSPSDLAELRAGGYKLPSLVSNIQRGVAGDFFSRGSEAANREAYSLFLSNPPWRELSAEEPAALALEAWRQRQPKPAPHIPKHQIAAGFALGAADCLVPGGRVALILPVNPFVSADSTQQAFRTHLLGRFRIRQIVNFSDMRRLMFTDAMHPFVVLIAEARPRFTRFVSVEAERFEYWTPKTDISLALGRLAVHGGDRADLPTAALIDDSPQLAIRYWGSEADIALLQRLRRHGRIRDLTFYHDWLEAKGFHSKDEDKRRDPKTWYVAVPEWMTDMSFLSANNFPSDTPVVSGHSLREFPFSQIARVPPRRLFEGPRVLWTDGAHPEDGVKAVYAEDAFSFQHSLAVLSAPATEDGRLMARFLTAYLRSPMGLWLLLLLSSSVASERPKLHVQEALDWPFWSLERHPQPEKARVLMAEVDTLLTLVERTEPILQAHVWGNVQPELNRLVYTYFGLDDEDVALIEELATYAGPAIQPTSLRHRALVRPLRQPPSKDLMEEYCQALGKAMRRWRNATGGDGDVTVTPWSGRSLPIGAAVLSLGDSAHSPQRVGDDTIVDELAAAFRRVAIASTESLLTVPDLALVDRDRIFLVKPLVARFWLRRCAIEDASRLALQLQSVARARAHA